MTTHILYTIATIAGVVLMVNAVAGLVRALGVAQGVFDERLAAQHDGPEWDAR